MFELAQQECPITTQRKRQSVKKRKNSESNSQQKHFLPQRDKRHLGSCGYKCVRMSVCAGVHALHSCTVLALLILNLERVVNTLPFPERAAEVLQNSSCVATLVEHGVFILSLFYRTFSSSRSATSNSKNGACARAWVR